MTHRLLRVIFQTTCRRTSFLSIINENGIIGRHASLYQYAPPYSIIVRNYAKHAKNRGGDKKKSAKVEISSSELGQFFDLDKLKEQFQKPIDRMKEEYIQNLTLRSSAGSLDLLRIKHDGKDYQLQEIAQIVRKNPKTIVLNLVSFPQMIPSVLQAIENSGMNLNPQQDGTTLFIPIPKLTKEHRENLAKGAKALYIKCRDAIKDVHLNHIRKIKNKDKVSEDEAFNVSKQVDTFKEKYIEDAKLLFDAKTKEILGE